MALSGLLYLAWDFFLSCCLQRGLGLPSSNIACLLVSPSSINDLRWFECWAPAYVQVQTFPSFRDSNWGFQVACRWLSLKIKKSFIRQDPRFIGSNCSFPSLCPQMLLALIALGRSSWHVRACPHVYLCHYQQPFHPIFAKGCAVGWTSNKSRRWWWNLPLPLHKQSGQGQVRQGCTSMCMETVLGPPPLEAPLTNFRSWQRCPTEQASGKNAIATKKPLEGPVVGSTKVALTPFHFSTAFVWTNSALRPNKAWPWQKLVCYSYSSKWPAGRSASGRLDLEATPRKMSKHLDKDSQPDVAWPIINTESYNPWKLSQQTSCENRRPPASAAGPSSSSAQTRVEWKWGVSGPMEGMTTEERLWHVKSILETFMLFDVVWIFPHYARSMEQTLTFRQQARLLVQLWNLLFHLVHLPEVGAETNPPTFQLKAKQKELPHASGFHEEAQGMCNCFCSKASNPMNIRNDSKNIGVY